MTRPTLRQVRALARALATIDDWREALEDMSSPDLMVPDGVDLVDAPRPIDLDGDNDSEQRFAEGVQFALQWVIGEVPLSARGMTGYQDLADQIDGFKRSRGGRRRALAAVRRAAAQARQNHDDEWEDEMEAQGGRFT